MEKNLSNVAVKLKSEWKNIYRRLTAYCLEQDGKVSLADFKKVTSESEVFLSTEDIRNLTRVFSCDGGAIDFEALSRTLGLTSNKTASIYH
jgi:Ca2+-binding EF-hand superfamily protein